MRSRLEGDDIGFIRVTQFTEQTTDSLKKSITTSPPSPTAQGLHHRPAQQPGGCSTSHSVSDAWRGEIADPRPQRRGDTALQRTPGRPHQGETGRCADHGGSASASEIVVGALQDHSAPPSSARARQGLGRSSRSAWQRRAVLTTARYSRRPLDPGQGHLARQVLQDVPEDLALTNSKGEASRKATSRLKATSRRDRSPTSRPTRKDDKALRKALDVIRGVTTQTAAPPNPKTAVPN